MAAYWFTAGLAALNYAYRLLGRRRLVAYIVAAAAMLAVALGLASLYAPVAASRHVEVMSLDEPIDVNGLKCFIPLMTAYAYASGRIQIPTHRVYSEDSYVYYLGNHSVYNWIIEPEGFWNHLTKKPLGVVFVYGDEYPPHVEVVEKPLEWGLHSKVFRLLFFDTLERRIVLAAGLRYKPLLEDNIEILHEERIYILVPLVTWKRGLLYSIPILYGYAVVDEDGGIEVVEKDRLASDPRFQGMPLLPEAIARSWVEAYRYRVGLIEFYLHHNTYVIRDIGTNPQPYLEQGADSRLYWVFVAEPPGETYSTRYIIYVEASHVEGLQLLFYEFPEPVIGISKVESYIKQAHPIYDWGELSIEEPMLTMLNGTLYWKATVTTKDYRGLVAVDIVNAATSEITSLQPRRHITYLDALQAILGHMAIEEHPAKSLEERINTLEHRIAEVIKTLEEIQQELQELQRMVSNTTASTGEPPR
ncbi:putative membrane protein [Hyperthermus butylicus DSM 5456]|uniref:Membrane protein n=1 Tax=Hyperthermus butylicus (strain DSM 5456 / JCM 9403 / PLM1-5) TaxID=415426 RepID=A2BJF4_HYPBU|nr:putative membrane protein [Hyperthermus butylicus DSM 5456]